MPTCAEVCLKLAEDSSQDDRGGSGVVSLLLSGLHLEEAQ